MKKFIVLFLVLVILVGCNQDIKPGKYVVIPVDQTVTPEVIHYSDSSGEYTIFYGMTLTPVPSVPTSTPKPTNTPTPVATTDFPTPTPEVWTCVVTSNTNVNFRSLPTVNTNTFIRTIPTGQTYTVTGRYVDTSRTWYQITVERTVGWVVGAYFDTDSGSCDDIGLVDPF